MLGEFRFAQVLRAALRNGDAPSDRQFRLKEKQHDLEGSFNPQIQYSF